MTQAAYEGYVEIVARQIEPDFDRLDKASRRELKQAVKRDPEFVAWIARIDAATRSLA